MEPTLTREYLVQKTDEVLQAVTAPAFLSDLATFRALKGKERTEFAMREMLPAKLELKGVPVPPDLRISSRGFDEDSQHHLFDYKEGKRIIDLLKEKRPDLMDRLKREHPRIYEDLLPIDAIPELPFPIEDPDPIDPGPPGLPDDPRIPPFPLDPNFNPEAWMCACGGAATVCAGAGGGAD